MSHDQLEKKTFLSVIINMNLARIQENKRPEGVLLAGLCWLVACVAGDFAGRART